MSVKNFFLPHPETHKRAHLLSFQALIIYVVLFVVLQVGFGITSKYKPDVLGISSNVKTSDIISLTNAQRQKNGLSPLSEDSRLAQAAAAKAQNMFAENYWAHYSPSGKDPWGFIYGAGYKFRYAGENLAKNFYNSPDVVNAWMASPSHRENILNTHYTNIGIAVAEGTLNGQPTVLVVQEFGSPVESLAELRPVVAAVVNTPEPTEIPQPSPNANPEPSQVPTLATINQPQVPTFVAGETRKSNTVDPYALTKSVGLGIVVLLFVLFALDLYILRRRAVVRLSSRHLPHLALLSVVASVLINAGPGSVI